MLYEIATLIGLSSIATDKQRFPTISGMNDMMYVPSRLSLTFEIFLQIFKRKRKIENIFSHQLGYAWTNLYTLDQH